jgi:hypothetical protein
MERFPQRTAEHGLWQAAALDAWADRFRRRPFRVHKYSQSFLLRFDYNRLFIEP